MLGLLIVRLQGSATSVVQSRLVGYGKVFSFCSPDGVFRRFWDNKMEVGALARGRKIRVLTDHKLTNRLSR